MRALLAIVFCLFAAVARAGNPGPCPSFHAGWTLSGPGPITNILWDQYTQQMYFIWANTQISTLLICPLADEDGQQWLASESGLILITETPTCPSTVTETFVSDYYPVPSSSVMQTFSQSKNWVQTFKTLIQPFYHAVLLQETNNCPVLQENYAFVCYLSMENWTQVFATENGKNLLTTENPVCATTPGSFVWVN